MSVQKSAWAPGLGSSFELMSIQMAAIEIRSEPENPVLHRLSRQRDRQPQLERHVETRKLARHATRFSRSSLLESFAQRLRRASNL